MKEITVQELKSRLENDENLQLIDVREQNEKDFADIGGELISMGTIPSNVDKIKKDVDVVIYCRSGGRSGRVVQFLEANHGYKNIYNLKGGILAWSDEIDSSIPKY